MTRTVESDQEELVEIGSEAVTSEEEAQAENMSADSAANAEAGRLTDIREEVEMEITQLPPSRVTLQTMELMKKRMDDIHILTKEYALGMSRMARKFPTLEESFKLQYAAD